MYTDPQVGMLLKILGVKISSSPGRNAFLLSCTFCVRVIEETVVVSFWISNCKIKSHHTSILEMEMEKAFVHVYLFLTCVTIIWGDTFKVLLVLGVVPYSLFIVKILFPASERRSENICEPETHVKTLKKPPRSVISKHIAPNCYKFSDAERISALRESTVSTNHVFRTSPHGFEYCEKEETYISELSPYYRCQRISDTEFRVIELGVMKMQIVQNHFRPDLSYKTCIAKFKII